MKLLLFLCCSNNYRDYNYKFKGFFLSFNFIEICYKGNCLGVRNKKKLVF